MSLPTITDPGRDPLGAMLLDYQAGRTDAFVMVESPGFEMTIMDGATMFRSYQSMSGLERHALELCEGRILDVGGGSGCHSLPLQQMGKTVEAIDISPGCVEVMKRRGVEHVRHSNLFGLDAGGYRTILMLMNGLGICGSIDGLNLFLQYAPTLLEEGGQILADSTDLAVLDWQGDTEEDCYFGETDFVMRYERITSAPFGWLYIDYPTLQAMIRFHGLGCQQLVTEDNGSYLVRITANEG